ncbi:dolichol-phosphate mannose synthase [Thermococcus chitonophagus]|uniref:Dolichol-phosphate mannose synthase n=1 Tax=Thermococcus chitonophagus TaxID=54262 RepID=A0A160VU96_9EURY|nr:glycosyltransferase family 2 protein [Thermococcus chitonophagus]ASJ16396.1 dolichol-phosphate mannose synthase [Thermococcus chitonophagus]CUX78612.1 dolichol-phosphate mannose synthase [Thermococcus chitonophagus]
MFRGFKITIVIPAYNEGKRIGEVLSKIPDFVDEVIVVDDGSTDNTSEVAKSFGATVVRLERNSGKGAALREGVKKANGDIIVLMDADGQHDPREIPKLLEPIIQGKADFVIGKRIIKKGKRPLIRKLSNWITSTLISLKVGEMIEDSQSGFRAIKRGFIPEITSNRYEVETEVLIKAKRLGARIIEVPISTRYDVETGHFKFIDIIRFLKALIKS